jgi:hypothetical protein
VYGRREREKDESSLGTVLVIFHHTDLNEPYIEGTETHLFVKSIEILLPFFPTIVFFNKMRRVMAEPP